MKNYGALPEEFGYIFAALQRIDNDIMFRIPKF